MVKIYIQANWEKSHKGRTRRSFKVINKKDEATPLLRVKTVNPTFFTSEEHSFCLKKKKKL